MHFSPGTAATDAKMERKLKVLKKRDELRKAERSMRRSLSHGNIDFRATEQEFLGSTDHLVSEREHGGADASSLQYLRYSSTPHVDYDRPENVTYVVSAAKTGQDTQKPEGFNYSVKS
ncbi:unnamed protein product [Gongylonema pulchrum]|uniref:WWC2 n=1 Tax=Gongylonema pulchrum TaxID=637853 RepID=A0A183ENL8_9BILA|nr:unnamed protein product [Gongylonema pulchrum]